MSEEHQGADAFGIEFGRHVRSLRRARGFTQAVLAERAGLSEDTIRRLEHGTFSPSLRTVNQLVGGLGLPLRTLFEAMDVGHEDPDLEVLIGMLRTHPELPTRAIAALVREMVESCLPASGE